VPAGLDFCAHGLDLASVIRPCVRAARRGLALPANASARPVATIGIDIAGFAARETASEPVSRRSGDSLRGACKRDLPRSTSVIRHQFAAIDRASGSHPAATNDRARIDGWPGAL